LSPKYLPARVQNPTQPSRALGATKLRGVNPLPHLKLLLKLSSNRAVLLLLFALALLPRLAGLSWGLPSAEHWFSFHPDERQTFEGVAALNPLGGQFNPHFFNYPSLFFYLTWALNFVLSGLGLSTPIDKSAPFPWFLSRDILFSARLVSALLGAAIAPLAFAWARRVISRRAALLAGVLCALSPGLVQHSHFATVDVPATFFVVWCLYLTTRGQTEGDARARRKYLLLAALVAGLAAGTKYNAVLVALAPLTAAILLRQPLKYLLALCVLPIVGFLIACPFSVLSFREFWGDGTLNGFAYELLVHPHEGSGELFQETGSGWLYHLGFTLPFALTWPVLLASVASLGVILRKKNFAHVYLWPIAAFAVLYFGAIGTSQVRFLRYILPLAPPLLVLAAALIDAPMLRRRAPQVLAGFLILISAWGTRDVTYPFTQPDAREAAVAFLRAQAKPPLPQGVALADRFWFYSPPLLPQNAPLRGFSLPATSPGEKFRVTNFNFDAARLLSEKPLWVASSEFEWRDKARLNNVDYLAWQRILDQAYELVWARKVQAPLALPGRGYVPHDFLYSNPEVRIYKGR